MYRRRQSGLIGHESVAASLAPASPLRTKAIATNAPCCRMVRRAETSASSPSRSAKICWGQQVVAPEAAHEELKSHGHLCRGQVRQGPGVAAVASRGYGAIGWTRSSVTSRLRVSCSRFRIKTESGDLECVWNNQQARELHGGNLQLLAHYLRRLVGFLGSVKKVVPINVDVFTASRKDLPGYGHAGNHRILFGCRSPFRNPERRDVKSNERR
jgi:hypothetical protein